VGAFVGPASGDSAADTVHAQALSSWSAELGRFGTGGRQAGTFHWPHALNVDSEDNIFGCEVDGAGRSGHS
jgi:hypothetical protein